jgi:hypothetical protein
MQTFLIFTIRILDRGEREGIDPPLPAGGGKGGEPQAGVGLASARKDIYNCKKSNATDFVLPGVEPWGWSEAGYRVCGERGEKLR